MNTNSDDTASPRGMPGMGARILIAGGGTGGHIFPAIAIANALKRKHPGTVILFVGAKGRMEMEKIPQAGYEIKGLDIAGFNRSSLIKNISLPFKLVKSFLQVRTIVKNFRPDGIIGVGGYSSFPVLRWGQARGIPTFIHESNSFAGKSNMLLGKKATKIFVATTGMEKFFPRDKIVITGNPVRTTISQSRVTRNEGIRFFSLDASKKTVFVVGGSLGAKSINEAISTHLDELLGAGLQLIWQTGKLFVARAREDAKGRSSVWIDDFIAQMDCAYAAADIVVSRAGAMAIAELCVAKKPVVFVPYPYAAEDHQTVNAMNLVNRNAALVVADAEAQNKVVPMIIELANDEKKQNELKQNIGMLAVTNADARIAEEVLNGLPG